MEMLGMPHIDVTEYDSPNFSERGASISGIVIHNTASSFTSALNWLCDKRAQASAHIIIGRDGRVACIVPMSKKAWHSGNGRINATTIGIEVEATANQRGMTDAQEEVLLKWLRWGMARYGIKRDAISIHRWWRETDCPMFLWPKDSDFIKWREKV